MQIILFLSYSSKPWNVPLLEKKLKILCNIELQSFINVKCFLTGSEMSWKIAESSMHLLSDTAVDKVVW